MENNEIMVSVCCMVYNHEKYLRRCLDGFIMQKTDFRYEVLIHDDASTDGSADIIREYEKKYPDIIKTIYQKENQYSKGVAIDQTFLYPMATGKYIALCEGDDYWCNEYKLQKQFDALEQHPECKMCVCKVMDIDEAGSALGYYHPKFYVRSGVLQSKEFIELTEFWAFQTSSYFFINDKEYTGKERPHFINVTDVGDTPCMLYFGCKGAVYYIDDVMSCYRHGAPFSFNSNLKKQSTQYRIEHIKKQIRMYEEFDTYSENMYHDFCMHEIVRYQFLINMINGNYRELFGKIYQRHLLQLTRKERMFFFCMAYFPRIMSFYKKRIKRK